MGYYCLHGIHLWQDKLIPKQEETWGVFNSVQGFGSMIGPLFGGLIAQFSNGLNNTFYFSATIFLVLAIFYGVYFVKYRGKANRF